MLTRLVIKRLRGEDGATAIEYAIIAGFISIVIVSAVMLIGQRVVGYFAAAGAAL